MSSDYSIEDLYSPSKWTKRFKTSEECILNHVNKTTETSQYVRENIACNVDIPYGETSKEKYDIIGTDLPDNAPIIFYIHGGYWQEPAIEKNNSTFITTIFHKHGIKSFVIEYDLCPNVELQEIVQQVQKALKHCIEYAKNKGTSEIHLIGHSAGAHLVVSIFDNFIQTLSEDEHKMVKTAFLIAGIYDLEPLLQTSYNLPLKLNPSIIENLSPMFNEITGFDTSFFIIVGEYDAPSFVIQSEMFHKKLKAQNLNSKLYILKNDHFDVIENLIQEDFQLTQIILNVIKGNQ